MMSLVSWIQSNHCPLLYMNRFVESLIINLERPYESGLRFMRIYETIVAKANDESCLLFVK